MAYIITFCMNNIPPCFRRWLLRIGQLAVMAVLALNVSLVSAQETPVASASATNNADADKAWKEVQKAARSPMPPAEWKDQKPTREQVAKFYIAALHGGADKAKDFYTRFPSSPKAAEAHKIEYNLLTLAAKRFDDTTRTDRLEAIEAERMKDPNLGEDERFQLRLGAAQRLVEDLPDNMEVFVKTAQALQKDFPKREEVYAVAPHGRHAKPGRRHEIPGATNH